VHVLQAHDDDEPAMIVIQVFASLVTSVTLSKEMKGRQSHMLR
jgi:hypothetical protein